MFSRQPRFLLVAAVTASLGLSACGGNKKDLSVPPPPPPPVGSETPAPGGPVRPPSATMQEDQPGGGLGGGLGGNSSNNDSVNNGQSSGNGQSQNGDQDHSQNQNAPPSQPGNQPGNQSGGNLPQPPKPSRPNRPTTDSGSNSDSDSGSSDHQSGQQQGSDPSSSGNISGYNPHDPQNVNRLDAGQRLTGGQAQDGSFYTSSAADSVLDFLRARNDRVSAEARQANIAAASAVVSANLGIDRNGNASLTLKMVEKSDVATYNLSGSLRSGGASRLRSSHSGGLRSIDGTLKCLDADGGCDNIFARLRVNLLGSTSIVNIIFRQSLAELYFQLPVPTQNPSYLVLRDFMRNTVTRSSSNRIAETRMLSWEVVNGRSGFAVSMRGFNDELLAFAGPLVAPQGATGTNARLAILGQDRNDSLEQIHTEGGRLDYASGIDEARLVTNNSLGELRLVFRMARSRNGGGEQFAITFMRELKTLVELSDENLK